MRLKNYSKQILAAIAAFMLCFLLCTYVFRQIEANDVALRRDRVEYLAENTMEKLMTSLKGYENIPQLFAGIVKAGDGEVEDFEDISQQLYEKNPTINAIQLSPDGVVTYSYPQNSDVIGHDLFNEDPRSDEAIEARDTGEFVVTGPMELVQGGTGLIIRYPIYLDDEFWGFSTIVLNYPDVFEDVSLGELTDQGYSYRLLKGGGTDEELLMGEEEELTDAVSYTAQFGRRSWTFEMQPILGWTDVSTTKSHRNGAALLSLLAAIGAFLIVQLILRNIELEEMKSDLTIQTKALAASEKANRMQTKALDASKKANDMQAEALAASKRANKAQIEALELAKRENVRQAAELEASQAANRAKTEFISRISHDIRTPIGAIQNLTEFALEDLDDREKLKKDLEKIQISNRFLLSLINDVLDISRVDSGKIELSPEPYPYEEYDKNIRNIMEPMCAEKHLNFEITKANENAKRGVIVADKIRINQIVLNILSNAAKYTPEGGTVRYISKSEAMPDGQALFAFTVEDTGIGMSEEFQRRMFEEFSQEYDNPNRQTGTTGTGLGLSIVKRMVDLMDGTISVSSKTGEGTSITVCIIFPDALQDERYASVNSGQTEKEKEKIRFGGHILVAEDNVINQEIALRIFEECGLTADLAHDGKEAVEMFTSRPEGTYDAIFMDIQMPNMNGYEATAAIRALAGDEAKTIPIVAMTADAFEDAVRKAEEVGMNEYVTKPLDVDYIRQILMELGLRV